jgi:hypothetical protein
MHITECFELKTSFVHIKTIRGLDQCSGSASIFVRLNLAELIIHDVAIFSLHKNHMYTVKKVTDFSVPCQDVTNHTLPGRE